MKDGMHESGALRWRCGRFVFDCARPLVMGIINVTPDSFSDGGRFLSLDMAVAHGLALLEAGADMLDVGGESTRPGAAEVTTEDEKQRILPVIESLAAAGAAVSADTQKPAVMRAALQSGAVIINDVGGFRDGDALAAVAESDCGAVIMHMQGTPRNMQNAPHYGDVVGEVAAYLQNRAAQLQTVGVHKSRICLDPGIGFGKTPVHNTALLRALPQIAGGYPLLVGVSRKSWFAAICGEAANENANDSRSAVAAAILSRRGANVLRVHDVATTRDAIALSAALL